MEISLLLFVLVCCFLSYPCLLAARTRAQRAPAVGKKEALHIGGAARESR